MSDNQYIEPLELLARLDACQHPPQHPQSPIAIVDVRGAHERSFGHFAGSISAPAGDFDNTSFALSLAKSLLEKDTVVVHCLYSQVRGPKCARILREITAELPGPNHPKILVLRGGFKSWGTSDHLRSSKHVTSMNIPYWEEGGDD
jgi:Cdc25 family phosphatase